MKGLFEALGAGLRAVGGCEGSLIKPYKPHNRVRAGSRFQILEFRNFLV